MSKKKKVHAMTGKKNARQLAANRSASFQIRCTEEEKEALMVAVSVDGYNSISEYVRSHVPELVKNADAG